MNTSELIVLFAAACTSAGSIGMAIVTYRKYTVEIDQKNISSLKTRVEIIEGEKNDIKNRLLVCEGLHRQNLEEKGKMRGTIDALEKVLENRDPGLQKILEKMLLFMERIEKHMDEHYTLA